jgi:hypothetical protein
MEALSPSVSNSDMIIGGSELFTSSKSSLPEVQLPMAVLELTDVLSFACCTGGPVNQSQQLLRNVLSGSSVEERARAFVV